MASRVHILLDSGFWIAFYDTGDSYHDHAKEISDKLFSHEILIPWPTLYEFINTKFARNKDSLFAFESFLQRPNVTRIPDTPYKEQALLNIFQLNIHRTMSISLVDEIIRQMLADTNWHFDFLVTYNKRDFDYFCQKRKIMIIDQTEVL